MMMKDDYINAVLMEMTTILNREQLAELKNVLIRVSYLTSDNNTSELSTVIDDTDSYIRKFELSMTVEEKSEKTISQYVRATKKFFAIIGKNFREISGDDALYYMAYLKKYSTNSATSRDNERKYIKAFFNWLFDNEYIYRNPFDKVKPIKRNDKKKEILTETEIEKMRDECKNDVRNTAIIDFMLATGIRVSELEALNISDVNLKTGEVSIYGQKTNTWRTVYIDAKATKHLEDYLLIRKDDCEALFVGRKNKKRLSKKAYEDIIRGLAISCGIAKHCTVHIFRKILVSKLYSKKLMGVGEIATIMGHSIATLQKHYLLLDNRNIKNAYLQCIS